MTLLLTRPEVCARTTISLSFIICILQVYHIEIQCKSHKVDNSSCASNHHVDLVRKRLTTDVDFDALRLHAETLALQEYFTLQTFLLAVSPSNLDMKTKRTGEEKTICMNCSYLFPSSEKTRTSFECPDCLGMKEYAKTRGDAERWWNGGEWGVPADLSPEEVEMMLQVGGYEGDDFRAS
jgi:predicted RNA-binding Zn-ribbon protein involved in translation (DUF1610 family)